MTFAVTDPDGELLATSTPAELARLARRGCPAHRDDAPAVLLPGGRPAATDRRL